MVEKPEILIFREVSVSHGCNQVSGVLAMPFPEARYAVLKSKRIGSAVLQTSFNNLTGLSMIRRPHAISKLVSQ